MYTHNCTRLLTMICPFLCAIANESILLHMLCFCQTNKCFFLFFANTDSKIKMFNFLIFILKTSLAFYFKSIFLISFSDALLAVLSQRKLTSGKL